jgi:acyl carrier protein
MNPPTQPTLQSFQRLIEQIRGGEPLAAVAGRDTRLVEDLGMASLELIALVYLCEQTFEVSLVRLSGQLETLRTAGQCVDALVALQGSALDPTTEPHGGAHPAGAPGLASAG